MDTLTWTLTEHERATLAAALDALLPPAGSFPLPSATNMIDEFIVRQVPAASDGEPPWPHLDADTLRAIIAALDDSTDMTASLDRLHDERPAEFVSLWRLAVFGYYSRPDTVAAIARDLAPAYHGAPLPLGYASIVTPWDAADPLQRPSSPCGSYIATADVRPVDTTEIVTRWREQET
jgi:hypothetical protein